MDNGSAGGAADDQPESATLFLEDTVQVRKDGDVIIGVVARTWHDLDDPEGWADVDYSIPGSRVAYADFDQFKKTGTPPRHYVLFAPSLPEHHTMLVHESECTLLDRALAFGDVVKRSLTSPQSGTVTAVRTTVGVRHSFTELKDAVDPSTGDVTEVPESELSFVNEWNEGDFVIYKNCWMGIVDEVQEDIAVRLENNSVVVVDQPGELEIPISSEEAKEPIAQAEAKGPPAATLLPKRPPPAPRPKTIASPTHLSPGQTVTTKKANLRRGRWLYGAYDASVSPTGVVVQVRAVRLSINWLCQNMMVDGRFVAVPRPSMWLDIEDEEVNLKRFRKSTGGYVNVDGTPFVNLGDFLGGGELQVGDRVCFTDLEAAVDKYAGGIKKIPRSEALGFDLNTFIVVSTRTTVRVLWQDMIETCEDACKMVPYLNVDDHEVWPGEIVIMKQEGMGQEAAGDNPQSPTVRNGRVEELWRTLSTVAPESPPPELMRPEKVGVVQTVSPADRVAKVRWFTNPKVEVAGGIMIPGSSTGQLAEEVEDVSFYEAIAHQALGCRRGDFVLIAPERVIEETHPGGPPLAGAASSADAPANPERGENEAQLVQMVEGIRGMVDGGLLSNLSAALGSSAHPQLQAVSRMLSQFPGLMTGQQEPAQATNQPPAASSADAYMDRPPNWIAEVVDLGLDGLITVRLGALETPIDMRVPIERLHIIFNEDMELDGSEGEDGYSDEDSEIDEYSDEDSDEEESEAIEERIIYEGGERMDNGDDEDWLTDEEEEVGSDMDMTDLVSTTAVVDSDAEMSEAGPQPADDDGKSTDDKKPLVPPPIPDDQPAPEAFTIASSSNAPPRFLVLDTPIPPDHAYASQSATAMSATFARRINKEHRILSTSLPEGIMVRTWESRLDLLRVLIIGPLNTPYELAPFVFDFYFPPTFPTLPPLGHFHSWTSGIGRVNPNLYEDGKICLSLLGTWHAEKKGEGWSSAGSSVLQLLVSLMGLVLVREPWYNEAGFTVYQGAAEATLNSRLYSEKAYILARGFVKRVLQRPVAGFEREIAWLYLSPPSSATNSDDAGGDSGDYWGAGPQLLKQVVEKARDVVKRSETPASTPAEGPTGAGKDIVGSEGVGHVSAGALVLLCRDLKALEGLLEKAEAAAGSGATVEEAAETRVVGGREGGGGGGGSGSAQDGVR